MKSILVYIYVGLPLRYESNHLDTHMYLPLQNNDIEDCITRFNDENENIRIHHYMLDNVVYKVL